MNHIFYQGIFELESSDYTFSEEIGKTQIKIIRKEGNAGNFIVKLIGMSDSGKEGTDFNLPTKEIVFDENEVS